MFLLDLSKQGVDGPSPIFPGFSSGPGPSGGGRGRGQKGRPEESLGLKFEGFLRRGGHHGVRGMQEEGFDVALGGGGQPAPKPRCGSRRDGLGGPSNDHGRHTAGEPPANGKRQDGGGKAEDGHRRFGGRFPQRGEGQQQGQGAGKGFDGVAGVREGRAKRVELGSVVCGPTDRKSKDTHG